MEKQKKKENRKIQNTKNKVGEVVMAATNAQAFPTETLAQQLTAPVEIEPRLFLGPIASSIELEVLQSLGITHVLLLGEELVPMFADSFQYRVLDIPDSIAANLFTHLDETRDFIVSTLKNPEHTLLINDVSGLCLGPAVTLAYLMASRELPYAMAFTTLSKYYPQSNINLSVIHQLKAYERLGCIAKGDTPEHARARIERLSATMIASQQVPAADFEDDPIADSDDAFHGLICSSCKRKLVRQRNVFDEDHTPLLLSIFGGGECPFIFVEPVKWMGDMFSTTGELSCPSCQDLIGQFDWDGLFECCTLGREGQPSFCLSRLSVYSA